MKKTYDIPRIPDRRHRSTTSSICSSSKCSNVGILVLAALMSVVSVLGSPHSAQAGGGPENVLLVYNGRSWSSKTIANHYAQLRSIPDACIMKLDWDGDLIRTDVATFRQQILQPILHQIRVRNLSHQIDYIVYSSDFPCEIDFSSQTDGPFPSGSLTGMTYLAQLVNLAQQSEEPDHQTMFASLQSNWYASRTGKDLGRGPTRGFRGAYRWDVSGERTQGEGMSYVLSVMLGFTQGRGNSVDEVIGYLQRSAMADGTHPSGTIYYCRNGDVRSATRDAAFAQAAAELRELGVAAEIIEGTIPTGRLDVQGVMTGKASLRWESSGNRILPGAICENLTSFGAVFDRNTNQTVLTELLRFGAAGSSGTVIEPYAQAPKFPHPRLHVHYARGCSLAEAFYQSVYGPYQLLVVGDPLCQPWAHIPQVLVQGVTPRQDVQDDLKLIPLAITPKDRPIETFHVYVDGQLLQRIEPGVGLTIPTRRFHDGHHELRLVAVEDSPIQTQGHAIVPLLFANHGHQVKVDVQPARDRYRWDERIAVSAEMPGASHLELFHHRDRLGRVAGERAVFAVPQQQVGSGPVRLHVVAVTDSPSSGQRVQSHPITVNIDMPAEVQSSRVTP